jgi:hypothetical protein
LQQAAHAYLRLPLRPRPPRLQVFLDKFEQNGCSDDTMREVLGPLQLACHSTMAKIVDLALGCLHKLVAHAWLQVGVPLGLERRVRGGGHPAGWWRRGLAAPASLVSPAPGAVLLAQPHSRTPCPAARLEQLRGLACQPWHGSTPPRHRPACRGVAPPGDTQGARPETLAPRGLVPWLQGESSPGGSMDLLGFDGNAIDGDDIVAQVIKMVIKCGETSNEAQQLAVVRALLTFTTAEHFIPHGECLLAAVRTVFNLALSSDAVVNRRTASNALLQMLNTIAKRVTQIQPRGTGSEDATSRAASDALEIFRSSSFHSLGGAGSTSGALISPKPSLETIARQPGGTPIAIGGYQASPQAQAEGDANSGRAAQFATLAAQRDLRGLEAALEAGAPAAADQEGEEGSEEEEGALGGYGSGGGAPLRGSHSAGALGVGASGQLDPVAENDKGDGVNGVAPLPQLQVGGAPGVPVPCRDRRAAAPQAGQQRRT